MDILLDELIKRSDDEIDTWLFQFTKDCNNENNHFITMFRHFNTKGRPDLAALTLLLFVCVYCERNTVGYVNNEEFKGVLNGYAGIVTPYPQLLKKFKFSNTIWAHAFTIGWNDPEFIQFLFGDGKATKFQGVFTHAVELFTKDPPCSLQKWQFLRDKASVFSTSLDYNTGYLILLCEPTTPPESLPNWETLSTIIADQTVNMGVYDRRADVERTRRATINETRTSDSLRKKRTSLTNNPDRRPSSQRAPPQPPSELYEEDV